MEEGYPREAALELDKIRTDGGTQTRASLDYETVLAYAADMQAGDQFPPIEVYYDGSAYWLADGFHRLEATRENGEKHISARVHQGTQRDAVLASASANARHGLRRTNQDKRRAVIRLLKDAEWGQWSDREIARRCHVSHPFVAKIREEEAPLTGNVSSGERVFIHKNGAVTRMNTERIGSGAGEVDDRPPVPFPDPLPAAVVVEVDRETIEMVWKAYSGDRFSDGMIKRPFWWGGKQYTCAGGVNVDGPDGYVKAERVVPVAEWPGRPLDVKEAHERQAWGPGYYFGMLVKQGSNEYVMDARDRLCFRLAMSPTGNVSSDQQQPAYAPIWELEQGVRSYLDWNSGALNKELSLDDKTLILVEGFDGLLRSGFLVKPWRKSDVRQAVNNVLDQFRQAEKRKAELASVKQLKLTTQHMIDELTRTLQLDRADVIDLAIEQLYERECQAEAKEPEPFPTF